MKISFFTKLLSCLLTLVMVFTASGVTTAAAADNNGGKYVKDVFIAYEYSKDESKAKDWLTEHGYQPIADLNAGKTSKTKTNTVAMLGITRTDDPNKAITDMAVMNMNGGYLALAGIGGLALGILGTALVMRKGRKKKEEETA